MKESAMQKKNCRTCRWHDDFSWACSNGGSPHRSDFTDNDVCCGAWEKREEGEEES